MIAAIASNDMPIGIGASVGRSLFGAYVQVLVGADSKVCGGSEITESPLTM